MNQYNNPMRGPQRGYPNAYMPPRSRTSDTMPLAIIGAVCMGIIAIISFSWMVTTIKDLILGITESYLSTAAILIDVIWILYYTITIAGAMLTGIALFIRKTQVILAVGTGALAFATLFSVYIEFYELIQAPSLATVGWIVSWLLVAAAWGLLFFSVVSHDKNLLSKLQILIVILPAVAFIIELIISVTNYMTYDYEKSLIGIFWRTWLYDIATIAGILMTVLVASSWSDDQRYSS